MLLVEGLLGLIAFLLGAALFSFMNVVAWRLPRGKNPLTGRSFCPQCGAALTAGDLVPVFSWLFLRGRCRHCRAPIPVRYLLVELLGGVLALGCRWRFGTAYTLGEGLFGMRWQGLLALALCGVLLSIALIDAETQLIPNRLNAAVAVLAVLYLRRGWLRQLGRSCAAYLGGLALAALPWFAYFGAHHALDAWWECYFYDNLFLYKRDGRSALTLAQHLWWAVRDDLPAVCLLAAFLLWTVLSKRRGAALATLAMAAGLAFTSLMGGYLVYYGLVLAVFDLAAPLNEEDLEIARRCQGRPALAILNKQDLAGQGEAFTAAQQQLAPYFKAIIPLTARDAASLQPLCQAVAQLLGTANLDPNAAALCSARQLSAAKEARDALAEALNSQEDGFGLDAAGVCISDAQRALARLTGEDATEATIDEVFSTFCVGK